MKLSEMAFDWVGTLDEKNLIKLVAKTGSPTIHPEDPIYPVRIFNQEELRQAARTLIGKPMGVNHEMMPIRGAYVIDAEYNDGQVEAIATVPPEWREQIRSGKIKNVSVEYIWRDEKRSEHLVQGKPVQGVEFGGLIFTRVDLVKDAQPGDKRASVELYETVNKEGQWLAEISVMEDMTTDVSHPLTKVEDMMVDKIPVSAPKTEPFAGYADMDACMADNGDKSDPGAYCAVIMKQAELASQVPNLEISVRTAEEALTRVISENTSLKESLDTQIEEAKIEAKKEVVKRVEAVLPKTMIHPDMRTRKLVADVKRVINA